jgi:L-glutamine:2-deoxy-scyllo-inosose/3-amino-2,3-dideoxy-scyllo-inosose aminotransferase
MNKLAINGGKSVREKSWPDWPIVGKEEFELINNVVSSGIWSYNGPNEMEFVQKFANYLGTKYAICAVNGTLTLQLILESLDIGYGDEVIVPGLTWQATASCCIDVNAIPILVDVETDTWCIDANKIEERITPNTKAIFTVSLYCSNPDIEKIKKIAKKHKIYLIEDAAQQLGTVINGEKLGSIGDVSSFSLQESKVLTCGEGGAMATNNRSIAEKLDALRNCGRRPIHLMADYDIGMKGDRWGNREVGNFIHSGNYRITEFQAAILLGQLKRLDEQISKREENAIYLNENLKKIEGIKPMKRNKSTDVQSYFQFTFRYDKRYFKNLNVKKFREALSKEIGFPVNACYAPLNNSSLYRPLTKNRYKINEEHIKKIDPSRFTLPVCENIYENESIVLFHSILLADKSDLDSILYSIEKIKENVDELL